MDKAKEFNSWLAVKITKAVGSMACAYAFALLSLISLPAAIHTHDPIIIVAWIAQTFFQLVLLPIILVGQNLMAEHHKKVLASHAELHAKVDALHATVSNLKPASKAPAPKVI